MHALNFLVAILLPYISFFSKLAPPESVPTYFFSEEAVFFAGEFYAVVFYWAGFLRNYIGTRYLTERQYFLLAGAILVLLCVSKIIFTLPYAWVTSIFAFGLGVLSVSKAQGVGKIPMFLVITVSVGIITFTGFILIGMGWFGLTPTDYFYYKDFLLNLI